MDGHDHIGHGKQKHLHASVDHMSTDFSGNSRLKVRLGRHFMERLGVVADDVVCITTDAGRNVLARLDESVESDNDLEIIRLDRLLRQALKAHLNESVSITPVKLGVAKRVELIPAVDVSTAHDLIPHLKQVMIDNRIPASKGAVLYIKFPNSEAGTTYEIHQVAEEPGLVTEETEVVLHYAEDHLSSGAFDVTFEDIGGMGRQIKLLRELVQLPLKFPHVYRHLGITAPRGILLYGPPGSGKTHLARAVANEVEARFYYINGPDIIGTYTGETEANLRRIFNEASHHAPSVIFIDEIDAMAPKRGETGSHADTRAVTQLLSLMDGLKRIDSVVVVGTTNRIDFMDPAFRRPGRFDREIFVGPPDMPGRREILEIHTRSMPLSDGAQLFLDEVAKKTHGFIGADIMELCRDAGLNRLRRSAVDLRDHRAAFNVSMDTMEVDQEDFERALLQVQPSALRETLITIPQTSWSDIGGLDDVKRRLQELVESPLRNSSILAKAGLTPHVGALLYGPSGAGKTLLAMAVAKECGVNFIAVDGPELFSKWLGETEEGLRHVFRIARQVAPTVIFFDQLDSIAPIRGNHTGAMTTQRLVNQLLAEIDGVEQLSQVIVLGATNRIDLVDPSVLRAGRFGLHILVPLPDARERCEILKIHLKQVFSEADSGLEDIAQEVAAKTDGFSGAQLRAICDEAKLMALRGTDFTCVKAPNITHMLDALRRDPEFKLKEAHGNG